ncbi:MAG: nickel pincer cofactor biosynthesis protein LarB, partial [Desulfobacteraceae bacterium]|nr:nickel pincer cofactor biosynthesis protein LarB [Desulfobacteraceae bacterium]
LLENLYFEDIDYAHIDHHRSIRKGFPEVIFGQGKTSAQIIGIMENMMTKDNIILATRVNQNKAKDIQKKISNVEYYEDARLIQLKQKEPELTGHGEILVISAGTSDIPVAKEALLTARAMGNKVKPIYDVGVAGIHRLLAHKDSIQKASVIIAVAGMEGALPSVVAGLVRSPVIAVPTSIGYGTSFNGLTALFGMLNSCSSNISVVNIDNGFGAGYVASAINHTGLS